MANEVLVKQGTQTWFGASATFSPADAGTNFTVGVPVESPLTLAGVVDGAGRQSNKQDLGAVRAAQYSVFGCVDFTGENPSPDSNGAIEYYWAPSSNITQANGNIAGNSGADADAPGGAVGSLITLDDFIRQCQFIGSLHAEHSSAVQVGYVGTFSPEDC